MNWEKMGRAIHLLVWRSSNRIAIIMYQGYANSNTFLWWGRMTTKQFTKLCVPHYHIAMGIFVHFSLNLTPWHLVPWPLEHNCPNQSDSQIANINITTISTIYMLLDVIWSCARYNEFELVVFGVTFAVVTRRSASGHGVSVLSVGDR